MTTGISEDRPTAEDTGDLPAKLSDWFLCIDQLQPGDRVVLVCRVSRCQQDHHGNREDQLRNLRGEVQRRGGEIVYEHSYVGSGVDPWLDPAVVEARDHGAILLAETVDRFIRPEDYHSVHNPNAVLRERHMRTLRHRTQGVRLMTLNPPDATPGQNRGRQTKRGKVAKGNPGGRPVEGRKAFRRKWLPLAMELRQEGWGWRRIANEVKRRAGRRISHMGIKKWIKSAGGA